jgi:hypothetical protein
MTEHQSDRKHQKNDPLSGMTGGLILILLGVLFMLAQEDIISWDNWWKYFLIGLGGIFILEALVRIARSEPSGRYAGKLIGGAVLVVIGGISVFGMVSWWPMILIGLGLFLILSSFRKAKA